MTALRWLAFGDLDAGVWGLAWMSGDSGPGSVALGAGSEASVVRAELEAGGSGEGWRLRGEGLDLSISALGEDGGVEGSNNPLEGAWQLSAVTGAFTLEGTEHSVDSLGWRASLRGLPEPRELGSGRLVAAWFEEGEGLTTLALRPRKARGQEDDLVSAALVESGHFVRVSDPRLSTTYDGAGIPTRAGVELWVVGEVGEGDTGEGTPGEGEAEPPAPEHSYRAAGEATGSRALWTEGELELSAQSFRWHAHGRDGAGVYLLSGSG